MSTSSQGFQLFSSLDLGFVVPSTFTLLPSVHVFYLNLNLTPYPHDAIQVCHFCRILYSQSLSFSKTERINLFNSLTNRNTVFINFFSPIFIHNIISFFFTVVSFIFNFRLI